MLSARGSSGSSKGGSGLAPETEGPGSRDDAPPGRPPGIGRIQGLAWIALAFAGALLLAVVLVAGSRSPVVAPFLALGGAALGAGLAGMLAQLIPGKGPKRLAARLLVVATVASLAAYGAGAYKYTYGDVGELQLDLAVVPTVVDEGATTVLTAELTLSNIGQTTVRFDPRFAVHLSDPRGNPVLRYSIGCMGVTPGSPPEADLIELAPGASFGWRINQPVAWSDDAPSAPAGTIPCGAALLDGPGEYSVVGLLFPGLGGGPWLVPTWDLALESEPVALTVR